MIDLRYNYPVLPEQHEQFRAALAALPPAPDYLDTAPPDGYPADRQAAATWLALPDYPVEAAQVQLGTGGHQALLAVALAARLAGRTVVADAVTYNGFLSLAAQLSITVLPCPMDADGMLPAALDELCRRQSVRAVYLMPTLHNPLTTVMPLARRQELVAVARQHDLLLLDDGAYGFLEPRELPSLAHLAPERGFFVYSMSKPVGPGLKLAYLLAPAAYRPALTDAMRASSGSAVLFARLASRWLADGTLARLIARKQEVARQRQAVVQRVLGTLPYLTRPASFHIWLPLPAGTDLPALLTRLQAQGVEVLSSASYQVSPEQPQPGLRLALGAIHDEAELAEGLRRVARELAALPQPATAP
ncbi:PLP-dependent aminotransferase family protein [Hymenobacter gummosus]|uniref:PLP-dependent aminotransferase family protein n=1 Tax=Hymenobacter gummosus TaxID=1776032 RepID=A0A3S0JGY9_9BACT|nr:PLP-dependent aminotransferase family protein [Hymenobacter gummosus]RTQ49619.1 PLP-dependent aminotransferase family protein [Hymenobacter gummosus]